MWVLRDKRGLEQYVMLREQIESRSMLGSEGASCVEVLLIYSSTFPGCLHIWLQLRLLAVSTMRRWMKSRVSRRARASGVGDL